MSDCAGKCSDVSVLQRLIKIEDRQTFMEERFVTHMAKEEASFEDIRRSIKDLMTAMQKIDNELKESFKERDKEIVNLRIQQGRILAVATVIFSLIALGIRFL